MTSETTERKPQGKWKWDACDRWMVGQGCEVGYLGMGIALRDRAPLYVALPGGKRHVFGLEGSAWCPHDFRLAVAWVALQLEIPVPWRTADAPPAEGVACATCGSTYIDNCGRCNVCNFRELRVLLSKAKCWYCHYTTVAPNGVCMKCKVVNPLDENAGVERGEPNWAPYTGLRPE